MLAAKSLGCSVCCLQLHISLGVFAASCVSFTDGGGGHRCTRSGGRELGEGDFFFCFDKLTKNSNLKKKNQKKKPFL